MEFGPPIKLIDTVAYACGLSFIGITDHSYDLACKMDNYLEHDATLQGWHSIKEEITGKNSGFKTTVLLGEEISARNSKNKVIHFGALGISEFIPGSNDGARRRLKSEDLSIQEAIHNIEKQDGISFAAHPGAKAGIFQRIFLNRGTWHLRDIHHNLNAFQAVNNGFSRSWYRAKKLWIATLLKGKKLPLIAGNDAHGDFNRYISLSIPFLLIGENSNRYLSYARTGIYSKDVSKSSVLEAIKMGKTFITTGPYLGISATNSPKDSVISHAAHSLEIDSLFMLGTSTYEFGVPRILRVFRGYYQSGKESLLSLYSYTDQRLTIAEKVALDPEKGPGYLRAELICIKIDGTKTMAATSPCYLNFNS